MVDFRVLGPVEAVEGDRSTSVGATREGLLLADLLVHAGQVVPSFRLSEDIWRGRPPPGAAATLPTYVRNLRDLLQPGRDRRATAGGLIVTRRPGYLLAAGPGQIDADRFERLAAEGRRALARADAAAAATQLRSALGLWWGPAYAEVAGEAFAQAEANRLEELRAAAVEARVAADMALGQHAELVGELEALVAEFPFREGLWAQLMVALYRGGRQADSLRAYGRLRRLLGEELGIEPTIVLRDLERDILLQRQVGVPGYPDQVPPGGPPGPNPGMLAIAENPPAGAGPAGAPLRIGNQGREAALAPSGTASHDGAWREQPGGSGRRSHNLPAAVTPFVGRAAELKEVVEQLGNSRLLTLTGAGGVGKTRLAVQAAGTVAHWYPDGVWMLELAPLSDEAAVPSALADQLGITRQGTDRLENVEQGVCGFLADRRVLLVLDNCEHLVGAAAGLVHSVLTACPSVSVLATSRTSLGVNGETTLTVPPLSLPARHQVDAREMLSSDAVVFFCGRARAARPDFQFTDANAVAVKAICRRLDGIPLALELAAAWVRVLSVSQIAERLADSLGLLSPGPRTAAPRHRTLRAALDWSYALLLPQEQAALRRLAVFPDHFDLDAATAVLAGIEAGSPPANADGGGLNTLAHLVEKSLVAVHPMGEEIRYRLLEPIRQYAGEKLAETGETDAARDDHRDWFFNRARELSRATLPGLAYGHRYTVDQASYQAALEWSREHGDLNAVLYLVQAHLMASLWRRDSRHRRSLDRVLAEPALPDHPARPVLLVILALLLQDSGRPDSHREERLMRQAANLAGRIGDLHLIATVDFGFAELQLAWGNIAQARSLLQAALAACERVGPPTSVGWCHDHLGWVAVAESDYQRAHYHFGQAAQLAERGSGDQWLAAHALAALAPLAVLVEGAEQGRRLAEEAVARARGLDIPGLLDMALTRAAEAQILGGDLRRAGQILVELLQLLRDVGSRRWLADALEMAALVLEAQAAPTAATEVLEAADAIRAAAGETSGGGRPIGGQLAQGRDRLLGRAHEPGHHQRPVRDLSSQAAVATALRSLGPPPAGASSEHQPLRSNVTTPSFRPSP